MSFTTRRLSANRLVIYDLLKRTREYHAPMYGLLEWDVTDTRARLDELKAAGKPVGITAFMIKATAEVVRKHDRLRTRVFHGLRGPFEATFDEVSINIPVVRDDGDGGDLLFPVTLRDVDRMDIGEVAAALQHYRTAPVEQLEEAQRIQKLSRIPRPLTLLHDYKVRSDPGYFIKHFGSYALSTIIHSGSGLVGVVVPGPGTVFAPGRVDLRPAVVDGEIVPRLMMTISFVVDHQSIDGKGHFLAATHLKKLVEDPSHLLGHL